jgi:hypothetical protein
MSDVIHAGGAPSKRRSPLETGFTSLRFGPEHGVFEMAKQLQAAMDEDGVDMRIVDMAAGGDIDREVFSEIVYAETFVVLGSKHYGQDTGNQASTFYESKFAHGKKKRMILIRMIPFDEEFVELQAQILFGMNKLELYWKVGTPMPPELPAQIMEGMNLPKEKITAAKASAKRRVAAQERAKQEANAQQAEHKAGPPGHEAKSAWEIAEEIGVQACAQQHLRLVSIGTLASRIDPCNLPLNCLILVISRSALRLPVGAQLLSAPRAGC